MGHLLDHDSIGCEMFSALLKAGDEGLIMRQACLRQRPGDSEALAKFSAHRRTPGVRRNVQQMRTPPETNTQRGAMYWGFGEAPGVRPNRPGGATSPWMGTRFTVDGDQIHIDVHPAAMD